MVFSLIQLDLLVRSETTSSTRVNLIESVIEFFIETGPSEWPVPDRTDRSNLVFKTIVQIQTSHY